MSLLYWFKCSLKQRTANKTWIRTQRIGLLKIILFDSAVVVLYSANSDINNDCNGAEYASLSLL